MKFFDKEHNMVLRKAGAEIKPIRAVSPSASGAWGPPRLLFRTPPSKDEQEQPEREWIPLCRLRFLYYYIHYYRKRLYALLHIRPCIWYTGRNQKEYHVLI